MPDPTINLVHVIAAGIINILIGMAWYSPYVLGKLWMKSQGTTAEEMKNFNPGILYVVNTITSLVFAYVLAHVIKFANLTTVDQGAWAGFWIWLGFVVTTVLPGYMFERRPKMLYFIYIIYQFISIPIMGGLLAWWR